MIIDRNYSMVYFHCNIKIIKDCIMTEQENEYTHRAKRLCVFSHAVIKNSLWSSLLIKIWKSALTRSIATHCIPHYLSSEDTSFCMVAVIGATTWQNLWSSTSSTTIYLISAEPNKCIDWRCNGYHHP